MPAARNVAAFPQWKSAAIRVPPWGQIDRALGEKPDRLARHFDAQIAHPPALRNPRLEPLANRIPSAAFSSGVTIRRIRSASFSEVNCSRARSTSSGKASGVGRSTSTTVIRPPVMRSRAVAQPALLQLALQHFAMRLKEQEILRIVAREDIEQELARRLQLLHRLVDAGIPLKEQAGHARDLPELAPGQLGGVEAGRDVVKQIVGREQSGLDRLVERCAIGREELQPVVVGGEGERHRAELRDAVGEEGGQPLMHQSPFDRVEKDVVPFPGLEPFHQQLVGGR